MESGRTAPELSVVERLGNDDGVRAEPGNEDGGTAEEISYVKGGDKAGDNTGVEVGVEVGMGDGGMTV